MALARLLRKDYGFNIVIHLANGCCLLNFWDDARLGTRLSTLLVPKWSYQNGNRLVCTTNSRRFHSELCTQLPPHKCARFQQTLGGNNRCLACSANLKQKFVSCRTHKRWLSSTSFLLLEARTIAAPDLTSSEEIKSLLCQTTRNLRHQSEQCRKGRRRNTEKPTSFGNDHGVGRGGNIYRSTRTTGQ